MECGAWSTYSTLCGLSVHYFFWVRSAELPLDALTRTMRDSSVRCLHLIAYLLILLVISTLLLQCELVADMATARGVTPVAARPGVLLITSATKCATSRGSYFVTKALQTKHQLARKYGWGIWVAGEEGRSASAYATLSDPAVSVSRTLQDVATVQEGEAAAMLLQAGYAFTVAGPQSGKVQWLLWMAADVLVSNPDSEDVEILLEQLGRYLSHDPPVHLLLSAGSSSSGGESKLNKLSSRMTLL